MVKVSSIVSTYNSGLFIDGCLADLISQSLYQQGGMEIIVVDSNSPGNEVETVRRYQREHANISYIRTAERETLYGAWNTGIRSAKGQYLTNANTDDRHHPEGLEKMMQVLESESEIDLVYGNVFQSAIPNQSFTDNEKTIEYKYKEFFAPDIFFHYQFGCQPMWRASVHQKMGFFNQDYKAAGDYEFNFRFSLTGLRARHIPESLGLFLERADSVSQNDMTSADEQKKLRQQYLTPENILRTFEHEGWPLYIPQEKARAFHHLSLRALDLELPWHPGMRFVDPQVAFICITSALDLLDGHSVLLNNLAVLLFASGQIDDARNTIGRLANRVCSPIIESNKQKIEQGATIDRLQYCRDFEERISFGRGGKQLRHTQSFGEDGEASTNSEKQKEFRMTTESYSQNDEDVMITRYFGIESLKDISVLDLGANDGKTLSNSYLAILHGAKATLVEPSRTCYEKLIDLYGDNPDVQCMPVAVSDHTSKVPFYESGEHLGQGDSSLLSTLNQSELERWTGSHNTFTETEVNVWHWDAVLQASHLKKFDLISIDIEGEDLKVLSLMDLNSLGCRMLIVEWNGKDKENYSEIATRYGMHMYRENAENMIFVK